MSSRPGIGGLAGSKVERPGLGSLLIVARIVAAAISLGFVWLAGTQFLTYLTHQDILLVPVGVDYHLHIDAARRVLSGGSFYDPSQLAGPYNVALPDILYPPTMILLFIPFLVLPAFLWWAIPLGIVIAVVIHWRPPWHAWPVLAFCLWWPETGVKILAGNPEMWIVAALALATIWRGFAPLVLLKPSLFPLALFGIRTRAWWVGLVALAVASLLFLPLWTQYATVMLNARVGSGILYSLGEVPFLVIPLVAWAARSSPTTSAATRIATA
jgi:hypothetical protein